MGKILFCKICEKILEIKKVNEEIFGVCSCGFSIKIDSDLTFSEKSQTKKEIGEGIFVSEKNISGFPNVCKKCGHEGCEVYDLGASYSDESNVYLYECKKCGFVERQSDGTSNT